MSKARGKKLQLFGVDDGIFWQKVKKVDFSAYNQFADFDGSHLRPNSLLAFVVFFIGLVFVGRLFILTVVQGDQNRNLADGNRIKLVNIEAKRGKILDRNGKVLSYSEQQYVLKKGNSSTIISQKQAEDLESLGLASENFEGEMGTILPKVVRHYQLGEAGSHVSGYISQVTKDDLAQNPKLGLEDWLGKSGIELSYENFLKGVNGKKLVEVDALGKKVSLLGTTEPRDGRDISLTVDGDLQKIAYQALFNAAEKAKTGKGAIVVQNPNTGEVLALASLPSFDPSDIGKAVGDNKRPFFNRAIQGNYPPGSTFKLVSALAGLESGQITADFEVDDVGVFEQGGIKFPNWFYLEYGGKDGLIKLQKAIARSNDIYFYKAAEKTGVESLRKMALKLGFGQITGIDLPQEAFGLLGDDVWKKATYKTPWYPGDTMHMGIGQGFVLATPIQIAQMTSFTASGKLMKPFLVSEVKTDKGSLKISPKVVGQDLVKADNLNLVRAGMRDACSKGGTGWPFFEALYSVGCKTGTAEQAEGNPNAWFTVFAPFDKPKIEVTVVIEDGGEGSTVAGPAAKEVLDWYFNNR